MSKELELIQKALELRDPEKQQLFISDIKAAQIFLKRLREIRVTQKYEVADLYELEDRPEHLPDLQDLISLLEKALDKKIRGIS